MVGFLSALGVIGGAPANSLPNFSLPNFSLPNFSLPNFGHFSLPISMPNFDRFSLPNLSRFTAPPPHKPAAAPKPDPVSAALKDIQWSQQQNAAVLMSLTQSFATQQTDLRRISRQLSSLAAQADALQSAVAPMTTSSIPHSNAPARRIRASRKIVPPLPKPFGPVSVGGAPLSPAPAPGSAG